MLVTKAAPEFKTMAVMPDNSIQEVSLSDYKGKKVVLFFYPLDFTFVCPTEITEFAALKDDFEDRDAVLLGGSTDNEHCKLAWRRAHEDLNKLNHWSFADTTGSLVDMLGIRSNEGVALRATYIIDPQESDFSKIVAIKDVVVVFPCVPPIAIDHFNRISSANISARRTTGISCARALTTSVLSCFIAVDITATEAPFKFSLLWPINTFMPNSCSLFVLLLSDTSLPWTE